MFVYLFAFLVIIFVVFSLLILRKKREEGDLKEVAQLFKMKPLVHNHPVESIPSHIFDEKKGEWIKDVRKKTSKKLSKLRVLSYNVFCETVFSLFYLPLVLTLFAESFC